MEEKEILTKDKKNSILKLTIRDFRNNFSKHRHFVEEGGKIIVLNRNKPILIILSYKDDILGLSRIRTDDSKNI